MGNRPSYPGTPRWVKVSGIIVIVVIVVVVLVVIMLLSGHDPGRHTSSAGAGSQVVLSGVTDEHSPAEVRRG
jgi:preprotein translocase subunit SecG